MPSHIRERAQIYRIASIPGDGIGVDITEAALRVLATLSTTLGTFELETTTFDWSSANYLTRGHYMPEDGLTQLKAFDAIYFGAVGWPSVPDHISLWNLILPIRKALNQYVNVRPTRILAGTKSPLVGCERGDLDWVIVRENSEGEYAGQGGISHEHSDHAIGTELAIFTQVGIERIMRFAFETARSRPRKKLTMVTKSNAQRHGMVLWDRIFYEVAKGYEDVDIDKMLVDAMTVRMVLNPKSLDTIVATNLHADILSDLAAALSGSIGIAPSSNLDPTRKNPSMFEPIHGSAPDIAGKGIANPVGAFWSAAEMVRWLGEEKAADGLMRAIENVTAAGVSTKDLGGSADTKTVTDAVCKEIEKLGKLAPAPAPASQNPHGLSINQSFTNRPVVTTIKGFPPIVALHPHMPMRNHHLADLRLLLFALHALSQPIKQAQSPGPHHLRIQRIPSLRVHRIPFHSHHPLDPNLVRPMWLPEGDDVASLDIAPAVCVPLDQHLILLARLVYLRGQRRCHRLSVYAVDAEKVVADEEACADDENSAGADAGDTRELACTRRSRWRR
ncbi:hypothetical protein BDV95DRAFT_595321 [Massariosphaeria phaeospora]|uniref:D-malate dehydrogenase (decarboxylating) n=1 Tax=Massariosphaeria phaeospora TaxID=100035 RepID=A0A7C8M8V8_9PLEO|nr:hypothetical protein BDV95DRAFT_595321 [Massariosphaeria phaeospora]